MQKRPIHIRLAVGNPLTKQQIKAGRALFKSVGAFSVLRAGNFQVQVKFKQKDNYLEKLQSLKVLFRQFVREEELYYPATCMVCGQANCDLLVGDTVSAKFVHTDCL